MFLNASQSLGTKVQILFNGKKLGVAEGVCCHLIFFPVVFYHCPRCYDCYVDWLAGHRHVELWGKPIMFDPLFLCTNVKRTFNRLS